jgi:glutamine synthetase
MQTKGDILKTVKDRGIEMIRFAYIDNDGVIRSYVTTPKQLAGDMEAGHPFAICMPFFSVLDDLPTGTRFGCTGELAGVPDPDSFRVLPWVSDSAMMICDFVNKADHAPSGLCARSLLKSFLADLEYEVATAFENEFYLLVRDQDEKLVPFDNSLCFATTGMNKHHALVKEMIRSLEALGITVEKYYPEYGRGQIELVYRYADALTTADNQVYFREAARGVAANHGIIASFMPKPFQHLAGSGAHLHFSLWKDGKNMFYDPAAANGLSETCRFFIGGVLKHLKALCAFTASTVNSYKRLVPHSWASAYVCYGADNREAAMRVVTGTMGAEEKSFNVELKPIDAACNPYLATLAVLAAGMDGVRRKVDPGLPMEGDPDSLAAEEKTSRGIDRLPETLAHALEALEKDTFFRDLLGEVFFDEYLKLKRFAWASFCRDISEWETRNYAEVF